MIIQRKHLFSFSYVSSKWRSDWQFVGQKLLVRTPLTDIHCYFWGVKYIEKCQKTKVISVITPSMCKF